MKITNMAFYGGARERVCRLGLSDIYLEVQDILLSTPIELADVRQGNSAGIIRERIDKAFSSRVDWVKKVTGGVDWTKRFRYNSTFIAKLGVEVQVSARSDLLIRDIVHLRNALRDGEIDAGLILVPSNHMQYYLTDRTPCWSDIVRYIESEFTEAKEYPIATLAIEHDGFGEALPKKLTNRGKRGSSSDGSIAK